MVDQLTQVEASKMPNALPKAEHATQQSKDFLGVIMKELNLKK